MIRFSGHYDTQGGQSAPGTTTATFTVYADENSFTPLWSEVQTIEFDKDGNYSVLLGSNSGGVPVGLFTSGESRWLEVELNQVKQPRVALVSVPYALKASDADTLGGLPASAYLLASSANNTSSATTAASTSTAKSNALVSHAVTNTSGGSPNYLAMFSDSTDLVTSAVHQNGNTVSIGGTDSLGAFTLIGNVPGGDAAGMALYNAGAGAGASVSLDFYNTWSNGGIPQAKIKAVDDGSYSDNLTFWTKTPGSPTNSVTEKMRLTSTGNVGIGTANPLQRLEVNGNVKVDGNMILSGSLVAPGGIGIGTSTPQEALEVNGNVKVDGNMILSGSLIAPGTTGTVLQAPNNSSYNFAAGIAALSTTTTGKQNTATGYGALGADTTGGDNSAVGKAALSANTTGAYNTAIGSGALSGNTTGTANTVIGAQSLPSNTTGIGNTAIGVDALLYNQSGNYNVAVGYVSGGYLISGSNNIYLGQVSAGQSEDGTIRIGNTSSQTSAFIAGIRGVSTGINNAVPVVIDSNGQLGTISSSRRFKEDIHDMGDATTGLMRLRPVTFRYKKAFADGSKPIQYGLIAEEVAEVYPDLVARSSDGQIETVKYQVLDSMLLNEVQRLHAQNAAQQDKIHALEDRLSRIEAALEKGALPSTR